MQSATASLAVLDSQDHCPGLLLLGRPGYLFPCFIHLCNDAPVFAALHQVAEFMLAHIMLHMAAHQKAS